MGMGKSSGNQTTTVQMTPEQQRALGAQTDFLTSTAFPAYQQTVGGAKDVYGTVAPNVQTASTTAGQAANLVGALTGGTGAEALTSGVQGLQSLFDPQYEQQQVQAALQEGRESARESLGTQNAMYGAAGGLGSARHALADANLASLISQRQATAAAGARAGVQANKAAAAKELASIGGTGLTTALNAAGQAINYASTPLDVYNKYAQVVFGIPQSNTTPNFSGTQGSTQTGTSKGFKT
jgi:hypothetical protein